VLSGHPTDNGKFEREIEQILECIRPPAQTAGSFVVDLQEGRGILPLPFRTALGRTDAKEIVMKPWPATVPGALSREFVLKAAFLLLLFGDGPAFAQRPDEQDELKEAKEEAKDDEEKVLEIGKWYPNVETGLSLTQSTYSDNWNGGDTGTLSWAAYVNSTFEQQTTEKFNWWSSLKLAYGQIHSQSRNNNGNLSWDSPDKSTDLIDLESVGRFTLGGWLDPYFALRGESQFQDQSDPLGRDVLFNPIRIRESAGVAHQWINQEETSIISRLGAAARQNFRQQFINDLDPFNEETELDVTQDAGLEFVTDARMKILEDKVKWTSRLGVYQPFYYSEKGDFEDLTAAQLAAASVDPDIPDFTTAVDIEWENIFTTQITKVVQVGLYLRWLYDVYDNSVKPGFDADGNLTNPESVNAAVRKSGQFKQTLGIGITYRLI
jgi:hypothetical protein